MRVDLGLKGFVFVASIQLNMDKDLPGIPATPTAPPQFTLINIFQMYCLNQLLAFFWCFFSTHGSK